MSYYDSDLARRTMEEAFQRQLAFDTGRISSPRDRYRIPRKHHSRKPAKKPSRIVRAAAELELEPQELVVTDNMIRLADFIAAIEPNFEYLFGLVNFLQSRYNNGRGRRFQDIRQFSETMLGLHTRELIIDLAKGFPGVEISGLGNKEVRKGYEATYGVFDGILFRREDGTTYTELDYVVLVDGHPLAIETTMSPDDKLLRYRARKKQTLLRRLYETGCGIAVLMPNDVYANEFNHHDETIKNGDNRRFFASLDLLSFINRGGIVRPLYFTADEFREEVASVAKKHLERPELIQNYDAA